MTKTIAVFFNDAYETCAKDVLSALEDTNTIYPVYVDDSYRLYTAGVYSPSKSYRDMKNGEEVTLKDNILIPVKQSLFGSKEIGQINCAISLTDTDFDAFLRIHQISVPEYPAYIRDDITGLKHVLKDCDLPVTNWFCSTKKEMEENPDRVLKKAHRLLYPLIVKPHGGVAANAQEYMHAFRTAASESNVIVTEKVVKPLRKCSCACINNTVSAVTSEDDEQLDASTMEMAENLTLKIANELHITGLFRVDFLMDGETHKLYINEIDPLPCRKTFDLFEAAGISASLVMENMVY